MIDFEKIGQRIYEQRKSIHRLSQEKFAEEMGWYQADVSNLEKAKRGSGISDLNKLDLIADYFDIPLETLLFGKGDKNMEKYYGKRMQLKESKKKATAKQLQILSKLCGKQLTGKDPAVYDCGAYRLFIVQESQCMVSGGNMQKDEQGNPVPDVVLPKLHVYVFLVDDLLAIASAYVTQLMQHVFQPALQTLQQMIPYQVLDVTDVLRTLNPYWALYQFTDGAESDRYRELMLKRMDELRALEPFEVLYIDDVYVREDARQHGLFRMVIDLLRVICGDCVMWLNMEPTSGEEMDQEHTPYPSYMVTGPGKMNLNAVIAECVGFTVDPDSWHRDAETVNADGTVEVREVLVRKCAYYLPKQVRKLLQNDGNLVALGRSKQQVFHDNLLASGELDDTPQYVDGYWVEERKTVTADDTVEIVYAAISKTESKYRVGVTSRSVVKNGLYHNGQKEIFTEQDDVTASPYRERYTDLVIILQNKIQKLYQKKLEASPVYKILAIKNAIPPCYDNTNERETESRRDKSIITMEEMKMENIRIERAICEVEMFEAGLGAVVGLVEATVDGKHTRFYCAEAEGMPNVYVTENQDLMDYLLLRTEASEEEIDTINANCYVDELAGLPVNDYEEFYSSLEDAEDTPAAQLIRLLFYMTRCSEEDAEEMAKTVAGKDVMEIEIPMTDIEEEM